MKKKDKFKESNIRSNQRITSPVINNIVSIYLYNDDTKNNVDHNGIEVNYDNDGSESIVTNHNNF